MSQKALSKQDTQRERVYRFYLDNRDKGKLFTVNHFTAEHIHKSTIYRIIKRAENESGWLRRVGSGRDAEKMPKKKVDQLKRVFDHQDKISYRQAGRKFNIVPSYVHKIIKTKTTIKKNKKKTIPDRTEQQKLLARPKCGRLYRKIQNFEWILDDESYFTLSHSTINGNDIFYSSNVKKCPSKIK